MKGPPPAAVGCVKRTTQTVQTARCVRRAAALTRAACVLLLVRFTHAIGLAAAGAETDESVRAGREALGRLWRYPWYDPATDGVRRIDVKEPYSWDWLRAWLDAVDFSWLRNLLSGVGLRWPTTLLGWIAWAVLLALFVTLVWLLYRAWRRRRRRGETDGETGEEHGEEEDERRIEALPYPVERARGDLLEEARRCYREGNFGEAIVYLFSYQLVQMDKHHRIQLAKGKTNRQYLREAGPGTPLGPLFEQTMVAFEDVYFGNRALERNRFERCWASLPRFEALLAEAA